jgi:hypothetical protein
MSYINGNSSQVRCRYYLDDGSVEDFGNVNASQPYTWAINDEIYAFFSVPILGWSTDTTNVVDIDNGKEIVMRATKSSNQSIPDNIETVITWDSPTGVDDTNNAFSSNQFVAPKSGNYIYHVGLRASATFDNNEYLEGRVRKNASVLIDRDRDTKEATLSQAAYVKMSNIVYLEKDETLDVTGIIVRGAATDITDSAGTYFTVYAAPASTTQISIGGTVEGGTGGSGRINYIENPDAEVDTSGWTTYADAAGESPVDGTGGSPTTTFTRTTTDPLIGTGSFLLSKDAANRQGEGFSYDFTIEPFYQSSIITLSIAIESETVDYTD